MDIKKLTLGICAWAAALCGWACQGNGNNSGSDQNKALTWDTTAQYNMSYHMETIVAGQGYGYMISVNGKKVIMQDVIPVVGGMQAFGSQQDAYNIGLIAARQMANGMRLPTISREDLLMYGIIDQNGELQNNNK